MTAEAQMPTRNVDALDRGDFTEVADGDLEGYLERLTTTPAAKRVR